MLLSGLNMSVAIMGGYGTLLNEIYIGIAYILSLLTYCLTMMPCKKMRFEFQKATF